MIINFTVTLNSSSPKSMKHMLRRPANWLSHLNKNLVRDSHGFELLKHRGPVENEQLNDILLDEEGCSRLYPFVLACKMEGNKADMYIESEDPYTVYSLYLYKWDFRNGIISSADDCDEVPGVIDWKMLRWCNHLPM
jgi:hypothetical protein